MRSPRLLPVVSLAAFFSLGGAPTAGATTTGECSITFNGIAVEQIDSPSSALELTVDDDLVLEGLDPGTTSTAVAAVAIWPVVVDSKTITYAPPDDRFTAVVDLDDVAPYGVGLMRITAKTDGCTAAAWLRLSGRFPLTTVTGIAAIGLTIGGVTGQLGAVASRRRWSRTAAILGGIPTGIGAAALAQQFGLLGPTYPSVALVVVAASAVGFGLAALLGTARRRPKSKVTVDRVPQSGPSAGTAATDPDPGARRGHVHNPSATPYWCYVLSDVDLLDLDDHTRVVGTLRPGTWYLARHESSDWVHVSRGDGVEGWASRQAVQRPGAGGGGRGQPAARPSAD